MATKYQFSAVTNKGPTFDNMFRDVQSTDEQRETLEHLVDEIRECLPGDSILKSHLITTDQVEMKIDIEVDLQRTELINLLSAQLRNHDCKVVE